MTVEGAILYCITVKLYFSLNYHKVFGYKKVLSTKEHFAHNLL